MKKKDRISKSTIKFVVSMVALVSSFMFIVLSEMFKEEKLGKCYDKFGSEILNQVCNITTYSPIGKLFIVLSMGFIIIALFNTMLDYGD